MSNISNEPIYNGTFTRTVDEKRRLPLPKPWKPQGEDEVRLTLIPWPGANNQTAFLAVFPPPVMSELAAKLKAMPYSDPKAQALRRWIGGRSETVTVDGTGRILISERIATEAGISINSNAVLVGSVDRFEIWSEERFAEVNRVDEKLQQEAFSLI